MSWYYWYYREQELMREKTRLTNQNHDLSRQVSTLGYKVRELEREKTRLSNENRGLSSQLSTYGYKVWELEREKTRLSDENCELSSQISTLGYKVRELQGQNTKLSGELLKQRDDTRKAGLMFMNAADTYQQVAKKQIRANLVELEDTRKAGLLLMNAADTYQEIHTNKKQIKDKVEELKVLTAKQAEVDAKVASLESDRKAALAKNQKLEADYDKMKIENNKLQSEVERLMMELGVLAEVQEAATEAFDAEKAEIMKELEDHKMKVTEI
ncbi:unnamed protein product [Urochloa decumbens]|uniref:Uncharacterized protein n=1 Tax=Urochloa decumbens TaxID=240449 RepID=A0ABC9ANP5_9POAL